MYVYIYTHIGIDIVILILILTLILTLWCWYWCWYETSHQLGSLSIRPTDQAGMVWYPSYIPKVRGEIPMLGHKNPSNHHVCWLKTIRSCGGVLKWGYPCSSSILLWFTRKHPAMGVPSLTDSLMQLQGRLVFKALHIRATRSATAILLPSKHRRQQTSGITGRNEGSSDLSIQNYGSKRSSTLSEITVNNWYSHQKTENAGFDHSKKAILTLNNWGFNL